MKNKHCITLLFLLGCGLFFSIIRRYRLLARPHKKDVKKVIFKEPVLFIHGYAGNRFSFGLMMRRFEEKGWGVKSAVVRVGVSGKITIIGDPAATGAMIQVLFDDNHASVVKQTQWLKKILQKLAQDFAIKKVDIIAHSMGAVSVLSYLTKYGNEKAMPLVAKLVTLGAPYNDTEPGKNSKVIEQSPLSSQGPLQPSAIYRKLKRWRHRISTQTLFLNIIGDIDNGKSDGTVSVSSARSLRYLLDKRVYSELIIKGKRATHRKLHENHEIDMKIKKFLVAR